MSQGDDFEMQPRRRRARPAWRTRRSRRSAAAIAAHNAAALRALLMGEPGPYRDAVLFNAAGALIVAGEVESWTEGVEEAAEALDKGLAKALLDCWIAAAN